MPSSSMNLSFGNAPATANLFAMRGRLSTAPFGVRDTSRPKISSSRPTEKPPLLPRTRRSLHLCQAIRQRKRPRREVLLDNGHGKETQGKRSPDGCLREWEYARDIALSVEIRLKKLGYDVTRIVPEQEDVKLSERVRRVNKWCKQYGATNVLVVSIHVNAAGSNGKWHDASGWQACVSHNASVKTIAKQKEKRFAEIQSVKPLCCRDD